MGKIKFGSHSTIKQKLGDGPVIKTQAQFDDLVEKLKEHIDFKSSMETVMQRHADTFRKLAQSDKPLVMPCPVELAPKATTKDKLARKHSKLVRSTLDKQVAEMTQSMASQDELFHILRTSISKAVAQNDILTQRIQVLEAQKLQEKQVVTETVVKTETSKLLLAGMILSLALSVFTILTH